MKPLLPLLLAALALPAVPAVAAPKAAAAARDWTSVVARTPEGGFRRGNPAAAMKLVEYGSLTCGHCATFAQESAAGLNAAIRSGRLSFEFRNFVRDPADLTASVLSRCAAPARYFSVTERMFAAQQDWAGRLVGLPETEQKAIEALPPAQRLPRIARASGLGALAASTGGVTPAQQQACLADTKAVDRLMEMRRVAIEQHGLEGTPHFLLNGRKLDGVHDWQSLQPHLRGG